MIEKINTLLNTFLKFVLRYGLLVIILFIFGVLTPEFGARGLLLDIDLDNKIDKLSSGSNIKQFFWLSAFSLYSLLFIKGYICSLNNYIKSFFIFMLPLLFIIGSSLFSDYSSLSLKRGLFQVLFIHCVILSTYSAYKEGTFHRSITISILFFLGFSFLAIVNGTAFNLNGAFAGINFSKNRFCINMTGLLILYVFSCHVSGRKANLNILFLSVLLIVLSLGKTIILAGFLLTPILFINKKTFTIKTINYVILFIGFFTFILYPYLTHLFFTFDSVANYMDPSSLTGRGTIWSLVYESLILFDKFNFGFGYGTFFNTPVVPFLFDIEYSFLPYVTTTHNGFIDLLSQVGFYGTLACFFVVFAAIKSSTNPSGQIFCYFLLVHNLTESSLFKDQHSMMFILIIITCFNCIVKNRPNENFQG